MELRHFELLQFRVLIRITGTVRMTIFLFLWA